MSNTTFTHFEKLESGEWGVRVPCDAYGNYTHAGMQSQVLKKDGDSALCSIVGAKKPASRARDWPGKTCPACGSEPLSDELKCWECGYEGKA